MYAFITQPYMLCASIGDVAMDAVSAIGGFLGDFIESLMNGTLTQWLCDGLKEFVAAMLGFGDISYDKLVNKAYEMLTKNPRDWAPSAWELVTGINNNLIATLGNSLIAVFFAIGFCKNSMDPHQDLRFENVLRMFIKLSVASWFMYNAINIVAAMFGIVSLVVGGNAFASSHAGMEEFFNKTYQTVTAGGSNYSLKVFGTLLLTALAGIVFSFATIGVGMMILYQAFTRFFKLLVIIPYGSIASTTLAGDHQVARSAASFYKYALNCVLEAATMVIAMFVFARLTTRLPEGLGLYEESAGSLMDVCGKMLTELILMMTMYGVIKQSSVITQRALGL